MDNAMKLRKKVQRKAAERRIAERLRKRNEERKTLEARSDCPLSYDCDVCWMRNKCLEDV